MYEYLMSLPPEDLCAFFSATMVLFVWLFVGNLYFAIKQLVAWYYCRRRQKKLQTTRCLFANCCPTYDNCPYNANSRHREYTTLKEWFRRLFKKEDKDDDD